VINAIVTYRFANEGSLCRGGASSPEGIKDYLAEHHSWLERVAVSYPDCPNNNHELWSPNNSKLRSPSDAGLEALCVFGLNPGCSSRSPEKFDQKY